MTSANPQNPHRHAHGDRSLPFDWHLAAIALGSNLGDSRALLAQAVAVLQGIPGIWLQAQSHWYQTQPVGPPQPDYWNGCVLIQTPISPGPLMQRLLDVEAQFGRVRRERWGPRTLDLDLLFYDDVILNTPSLTLPHPHLHERAFVLVPLAEIAPNWIHPVLGQAIADLRHRVDCSGIRLSTHF